MSYELMSFIYIPIIFIIGFVIANKTAKIIKNKIIIFVFIEHMLFSFLFFQYAQTTSADANMYYNVSLKQEYFFSSFGTDTQFIIFITSVFSKYLFFSKLSTFFLYGLFGFLGFHYMVKILYSYNDVKNVTILYSVLLLPGFHFWTSALGKDSMIFMSLMMFFYSLHRIQKHFLVFLISSFLIFIIRPHLAFILVISMVIAIMLKNPLKYQIKHLFSVFILIIATIIFIPYIASFLNIEQLELNEINEKIEFYNDYGASNKDELSSYVDVTSYNLPMKLFAYLFRPLFFDVHSMLQLLASFENLFLLFIIFKWLFSIKFRIIKWYNSLRHVNKIMFVYSILSWIVFAASMYNLGLASRQKYMILPVLFILIHSSWGDNLSRHRFIKTHNNF